MQRLEVSCAVRPLYGLLGAKGLSVQTFRSMLMLAGLLPLPTLLEGGIRFRISKEVLIIFG
jgi:hypothetical protein